MRTTLDLDAALLEQAQHVMRARSKKEAVEMALREAIARRARQELVSRLGTVEFDLSWDDLHRLREGD